MYQLYGLIDGSKFNEVFDTIEDLYSELASMNDQLKEADGFSLYIVNPEGTNIQEFSK